MRAANGTSPAVATLELFRKAQAEIAADQSKLAAWTPILSQMGPSLVIDCEHAIKLSGELVEAWARDYMFAGDKDAAGKAKKIAEYLGDHKNFKSHGRAIKIPELIGQGVNVKDLSTRPDIHDAITVLYSCLDIMMTITPLFKLFENTDARQQQMQLVPKMSVAAPTGAAA
jgi:hypothetical protein